MVLSVPVRDIPGLLLAATVRSSREAACRYGSGRARWTGIAGLPVSVEVVINRGLPGYHLVGLPGTEVRESRERVLSALRHGGVRVPPGRITVNLAPAGVRKSGASFDLAIALGIAAAVEGWSVEGAVAARLRSVFLGELSLFGELRPVRGLLPVLLDVAGRGRRTAIVPAMQLREAELVPGLQVVAARDLAEVLDWCRRGCEPERPEPACRQEPRDGAGALASGSVAAAEGGDRWLRPRSRPALNSHA
jgi:predicted ATPase with chaperone activity